LRVTSRMLARGKERRRCESTRGGGGVKVGAMVDGGEAAVVGSWGTLSTSRDKIGRGSAVVERHG
jgi:hypothetical protein